jgi:hypothetical protein
MNADGQGPTKNDHPEHAYGLIPLLVAIVLLGAGIWWANRPPRISPENQALFDHELARINACSSAKHRLCLLDDLDNFGLTYAKFERLGTGMSYDEVAGIIGRSGREAASSFIAGHSFVTYTWSEPDGANISATFQDGSLVSKAQAGLQ